MNNVALNAAISKLTSATCYCNSPLKGNAVAVNGLAAAINLRSVQGAYYTADAVTRAEALIAAGLKAVG